MQTTVAFKLAHSGTVNVIRSCITTENFPRCFNIKNSASIALICAHFRSTTARSAKVRQYRHIVIQFQDPVGLLLSDPNFPLLRPISFLSVRTRKRQAINHNINTYIDSTCSVNTVKSDVCHCLVVVLVGCRTGTL